MIVTPRYVYLQLQKTGCTHIEALIKALTPEVRSYGKHYRLPDGFPLERRLVLGSVRNPWAWYLSYWTYSTMGKGGPYERSVRPHSLKDTLFDSRLENGRGVLRRSLRQLGQAVVAERSRPVQAWRRAYDHGDPGHFRDWLRLSLDSRRRFDLFQDYGHSSLSSFAGVLSYLYLFLYTRDGKLLFQRSFADWQDLLQLDAEQNLTDAVIRTESLEADFFDALAAAGHALSAEQQERLAAMDRHNASERRFPLDEYYDRETIEMVTDRDRFLIAKFGYAYPGAESGT